jgi:hypothetical protein
MRLYLLVLLLIFISALCHASLIDAGVVTDGISKLILELINGTLSFMIKVIDFFLSYNPKLGNAFDELHARLIELLVPLYLLVLSWNGIQIMTSDVVYTQANARITLQNTLLSMVLVSLSLPIYNLLVNISQFVSSYFVTTPLEQTGEASLLSANMTVFLFLTLISLLGYFLLFLLIRFVAVSVGAVLFPFAIFLYFFNPTKRFGKSLLSMIILFLFIQVLISLVLSVCNTLFTTPPSSTDAIGDTVYRTCVLIGIFAVLDMLITMIVLQIALTVVFPELKVPSLVMSAVGSGVAAESKVARAVYESL